MATKRKLTVSINPAPIPQVQPDVDAQQRLKQAEEEKKQAKEAYQKASDDFTTQSKQKEAMQKERARIQDRVANQEKKAQDVTKKYAAKLDNLNKKHEDLIVNQKAAQKELSSANENLTRFRPILREAQEKFEAASKELNTLVKNEKENSQALQKIESDISQKQSAINALTEKQRNTDKQILAVRAKITDKDLPYNITLANASLSARLEVLSKKIGRASSQLDMDDEEYKEYTSLQAEVAEMEKEERQMQDELKSLINTNKKDFQQKNQLNNELKLLQGEKTQLLAGKKEFAANISTHQSLVDTFEKEVNVQSKKLAEASKQADTANDKLKKTGHNMQALEKEIQATTQKGNKAIQAAQSSVSKLQKQETELDEKIKAQIKIIDQSYAKVAAAGDISDKSTDNVEKIKQEIKDAALASSLAKKDQAKAIQAPQQAVSVQPSSGVQPAAPQPVNSGAAAGQAGNVQPVIPQPVINGAAVGQAGSVQPVGQQQAPVKNSVAAVRPGSNPLLAAASHPSAPVAAQAQAVGNDGIVVCTYTTRVGNTVQETAAELSIQSDKGKPVNGLQPHQDDAMAIIILSVEKGLGVSPAKPLQIETDDPEMLEAALLTAKALGVRPAHISLKTTCPNITAEGVYKATGQRSVELYTKIQNNIAPEKTALLGSKKDFAAQPAPQPAQLSH